MSELIAFCAGCIITFLSCRFVIYGTIKKQSTKSLRKFISMVQRIIDEREAEREASDV